MRMRSTHLIIRSDSGFLSTAANNRLARARSILEARQSDGRVYARFNPLGARSGRFSSSEPNLQQINRAGLCRAGFGAPPGYVLIVLDYAQIEMLVAAFLSQDPVMLEVFRSGGDMHKSTAALILRVALAAVEKAHRQTAKAGNFGLLFGQRANGLVNYARSNYSVTMTIKQAEQFRRKGPPSRARFEQELSLLRPYCHWTA